MSSRRSIIYRGGLRPRAFSASIKSSSKSRSLTHSGDSFKQRILQAQEIAQTKQESNFLDNIRNALAPSSNKFQSSRKRKIEKTQNDDQRNGPISKEGISKIKRGKTKQYIVKKKFFHEIEESDESIFHFDDDTDEINCETKSPVHLNFENFENRAKGLKESEEIKEREFFEKKEDFCVYCLPDNNSVLEIPTNVLKDEMNDFHKQQKLGLFNFDQGRANDGYQPRKISSEAYVERYLFEYQENKKERPKMRLKIS